MLTLMTILQGKAGLLLVYLIVCCSQDLLGLGTS